jgi:hypothetical protein
MSNQYDAIVNWVGNRGIGDSDAISGKRSKSLGFRELSDSGGRRRVILSERVIVLMWVLR